MEPAIFVGLTACLLVAGFGTATVVLLVRLRKDFQHLSTQQAQQDSQHQQALADMRLEHQSRHEQLSTRLAQLETQLGTQVNELHQALHQLEGNLTLLEEKNGQEIIAQLRARLDELEKTITSPIL